MNSFTLQMDDDKIQYLTRWLPETLSPNVKVVLSMINDTECHRLLRSYKSGPREITCGQLDYHSRRVQDTMLCLLEVENDIWKKIMEAMFELRKSTYCVWLDHRCHERRLSSGQINAGKKNSKKRDFNQGLCDTTAVL